MSIGDRAFRNYLSIGALVAVALLAAVMGLNSLIDPLWYFERSIIAHRSFPFDERTSKSIRLIAAKSSYDCLVFGGSRTTLLHEADIPGQNCFNYSFSAAQAPEIVSFAEYARVKGINPELVIVEVDMEDIAVAPDGSDRELNIPEFVSTEKDPAPFWQSYISVDALRFSLRRLLYRSRAPRYYDANFTGQASKSIKQFHPEHLGETPRMASAYSGDIALEFARLRSVFPKAKIVGIVSYINAWDIRELERRGLLEGYLESIYTVSRVFDVFLDLAIPSEITRDPSLTYDGIHYYPEAFDAVTQTLGALDQDTAPEVGIRVDKLGLAAYQDAYYRALQQ